MSDIIENFTPNTLDSVINDTHHITGYILTISNYHLYYVA